MAPSPARSGRSALLPNLSCFASQSEPYRVPEVSDTNDHHMRQGIGTVGEGPEPLWKAPLECKKLVCLDRSDPTTDRAVVFTGGWLPEQFVFSTDLRIYFGSRSKPFGQKIGPGEVFERTCWRDREKRVHINHAVCNWGDQTTAGVHGLFLCSRARNQWHPGEQHRMACLSLRRSTGFHIKRMYLCRSA